MVYLSNKISIRQNVLFIVLFFLMWTLWGFNTSNADYLNYEQIYNYMGYKSLSSYGGVELGFGRLMYIVNQLGINYQGFLKILSFICLILYGISFKRLSDKPGYLFIMYLYFPFFLDIMQIRNALAAAIVVNALPYILKKKYIIFTIIIIIASFFHTTSLFYLLLLLTQLDLKKVRYISFIGSLVVMPIVIYFKDIFLNMLRDGQKYIIYFRGNSVRAQLLYFLFMIIFILICSKLEKNTIALRRFNGVDIENDYFYKVISFLHKTSYIMMFLLPLLWLDSDFFRLFRNIIILFYVAVIDQFNTKTFIKKYIIFDVASVIFIILVGINYLYYYQWDSLFIEVLKNNLFWESFK